jgi:hypothetical protein
MNSPQKPRNARVQNNNNNKSPKPKKAKVKARKSPFDSTIGGSQGYAPLNQARSIKLRSHEETPFPIKRVEFVGNLKTTGNSWEVIKRLRINPGSKDTFEWLSGIAGNFERYRFKKVKFIYLARCTPNTAGSLVMSPDYDAADKAPISEKEQAASVDTVEDAPWKNQEFVLSVTRMNKAYKSFSVMSDARFVTTKQDVKTVDCAQVTISGDPDVAGNWGKLWIDYEVDLFNPQADTEPGVGSGGKNVLGNPSVGSTFARNNPFSIIENVLVSPSSITETAAMVMKQKDLIPTLAQIERLNLENIYSNPEATLTGVIGQLAKPFLGSVNLEWGGTVTDVSVPISGNGWVNAILPNGKMSLKFPSNGVSKETPVSGPYNSVKITHNAFLGFESDEGAQGPLAALPIGTLLTYAMPQAWNLMNPSLPVLNPKISASIAGMEDHVLKAISPDFFQKFSSLT